MPSGGNSVDIDSIMLNIDAESKGASDSIDDVCKHLEGLKSALTGMQGKTQALRNIANALHVISQSKVNLTPITNQLQEFSKLNLKNTGLTQLVGNLQKLSTVTGQVDVKVFGDFAEEMKKLNDVSSSSAELLKAVNSFTRSSEKMKEAAANFPALSAQIQEFFTTMSNVTVSDSTVRMAEALADIARNGVNANSEMKRFSQSSISSQKAIKILDVTIESIKDGFKQLGKILMGLTTGIKNFAGKAVEGVKSLASKIKEMVSNKGGVETLHISLKSLFTTLIGFHSIRGLFSWTKDALEAGGALTEVNHIVESMYGDMSDSVKAWADTMIDRYGIASMQAKQYAGTLTAMSKAAGVATDQATEIGLKLTEAAGDISAFFNIDTADAYQKLQSGLAGQVRPLRSLGIDLTAATLKQFAFDEGIEKSYKDMTQAEKITLRYNYIMKVLSSEYERGIGVLGDYERTQYSYANSLRKLTAYMEQIKTQIGAGFTAAIRPVLVVLNELMSKLLKAAKAFTTFMQTLFPFENGASGMALADSSEYAEDLAEGTNDAADGLSAADTAAKKLKKDLSVLPFDELNQLNKDKKNTSKTNKSAGGTDAVPLLDTGGLFDWDGFYDSLEDKKLPDAIDAWAKRIKDAFDRHDWEGLGTELATGINKGIQWLYEKLDPEEAKRKIDPFVSAVTTTLNSLIDGVDFYTLGSAIGEGMTIVFNTANSFMEQFDWPSLGRQLGNGANGLIDNINWESLGNLMANRLNVITGVVSGFANRFKWGKFGGYLAKGANAFVNKINKEQLASAVGGTLNGITETVKQFALQFGWESFGESLASQANLLVDKINFTEMGNTVSIGLNGILTTVGTFLTDFEAADFGADLAGLFTNIIDKVKWETLGDDLAKLWNKAWEFLKSFVKGLGADTSIEGLTTDALRGEKINANKLAKGILPSGGTGLGKAIHDALEGAISNVKTEDMIDTITTLVGKIADDIITVFGDESMWYELGHKIGEVLGGMIGNPENAEKAAAAINALTTGIRKLFVGAIDALKEHKEEIGDAIKTFLEDVDWGGALLAAAPVIAASFVGVIPSLVLAGVKTAIKAKLYGAFVGAGKGALTEAVADEGIKTAASGFGTKLATLASSSLVEAAAGWIPIAGVLGVALVGAIYGNTEEGRAEMKRCREALDKDVKEMANGVENTFYGTGTNIETETGRAALAVEQRTEEFKNNLAISLNGLAANGKLSTEQLNTYIKGIYSGDNEVINEAVAFRDSINGTHTSMETSASTLATNIQSSTEKVGGFLGGMSEKLMGVDSDLGTLAEDAKQIPTSITTGVTHTQGMPSELIGKMKGEMLAKMFGNDDSKSNEFETKAEGIPEKVKSGIESKAKDAKDASETLGKDVANSLDKGLKNGEKGIGKVSEAIPSGVKQGIINKKSDAISGVNELVGDIYGTYKDKLQIGSPSKLFATASEFIPDGVKKGINDKKSTATEAVGSLVDSMNTKFNTSAATMNTNLYNKGGTFTDKIASGMKSKLSSFESAKTDVIGKVSEIITGITNKNESAKSAGSGIVNSVISGFNSSKDNFSGYTFASNLISGMSSYFSGLVQGTQSTAWWWGRNIVQAFINGLKSLNVPTLHVDWTDNEFVETSTDGSGYWVPVFTTSWYKKGGLFTDPSIIGVGEAGTETVLPLENKRTMGMIADAIIGNSGGLMDENALANAVASGYVRAMMANQGNQQQPIFNIVVKTENDEVLARAVTRGQQSIDYRNNPTPRYNY